MTHVSGEDHLRYPPCPWAWCRAILSGSAWLVSDMVHKSPTTAVSLLTRIQKYVGRENAIQLLASLQLSQQCLFSMAFASHVAILVVLQSLCETIETSTNIRQIWKIRLALLHMASKRFLCFLDKVGTLSQQHLDTTQTCSRYVLDKRSNIAGTMAG